MEVNGTPVFGKKDLIKNIEASHGETVELLVNRNGEQNTSFHFARIRPK